MEHPMQKLNDLSRSLAPLEPDGTLIAVIEMSQSSSPGPTGYKVVARLIRARKRAPL
jgi:hypothetical protein